MKKIKNFKITNILTPKGIIERSLYNNTPFSSAHKNYLVFFTSQNVWKTRKNWDFLLQWAPSKAKHRQYAHQSMRNFITHHYLCIDIRSRTSLVRTNRNTLKKREKTAFFRYSEHSHRLGIDNMHIIRRVFLLCILKQYQKAEKMRP